LAKDDNKFFIIQAVQIGEPPSDYYYLFSRWGRVGVPGKTSVSETPLDRKEVIRQYNAKTQAKVTRGGYKVIEVNYEQGPIE
jgi:predicted DNA-binding WGR domain protein